MVKNFCSVILKKKKKRIKFCRNDDLKRKRKEKKNAIF